MNAYSETKKRPVSASAVVRIVIWSVVLAILVALFTLGMLQASFGNQGFDIGLHLSLGGYVYRDADSYRVGSAELDASTLITSVDIDWLEGDIRIVPGDVDHVIIEEDYSGGEEDWRCRWKVDGGKLTVKYRNSYWLFGLTQSMPEKTLTITFPQSMLESMKDVRVNAVESDITYTGNARKLSLDVVEGDVAIAGSVDELEWDGVEGRINFRGALGHADIDGVENTLEMYLTAAKSLDVDGVESNVTLYLAETITGFAVERDSVGGTVRTDDFDGVSERGDYDCYWGDGSVRIDLDGVSTTLTVAKDVNHE